MRSAVAILILFSMSLSLSGHADSTDQAKRLHDRIAGLVQDLEAIDRSLHVFAPHIETQSIAPRFRPPENWSKRGEMTRLVLGILRLAKEPLTTRDVAAQLIAERGMDPDEPKLLRLMAKRVGVALRRQREGGVVKATQGPGQYMLWELDKAQANGEIQGH